MYVLHTCICALICLCFIHIVYIHTGVCTYTHVCVHIHILLRIRMYVRMCGVIRAYVHIIVLEIYVALADLLYTLDITK